MSVFFPFMKLFYLLTLITSHDIEPEFRRKSIATMEWLGRYSMTDVMVLALMIFLRQFVGLHGSARAAGRVFLRRQRADHHAGLRLGQRHTRRRAPRQTATGRPVAIDTRKRKIA